MLRGGIDALLDAGYHVTAISQSRGKPVRSRRCPATVIADDSRWRPLSPDGKARPVGRSESQDTAARGHRDGPRGRTAVVFNLDRLRLRPARPEPFHTWR